MLRFDDIDVNEFLKNYWQKKPLVIRQALPDFVNQVSGDELAGLAMEEEIESRIVCETPGIAPGWKLKRGPFDETDFSQLPATHWTLLVQGVDRFVPEVHRLLDHFNFLPAWRVDDVMISYAAPEGSVGPHYDNYDVFLYQAKGRRRWLLTTKNCDPENHQPDLALRIMRDFQVETDLILEEGDMLYLPPHVGHHGVSLSDDCMTYSFGYRSYQAQELWDSFGEHLAMNKTGTLLYHDPDWRAVSNTAEIPQHAWIEAKKTLQAVLDDEQLLKHWFASFATSLDQQAESLLPLEPDETGSLAAFQQALLAGSGLFKNPLCRFAYLVESTGIVLFINGCKWDGEGVTPELLVLIANNRELDPTVVQDFVISDKNKVANLSFLYDLWKLQWIDIRD